MPNTKKQPTEAQMSAFRAEELWDWIHVQLLLIENSKEVENAIRELVELKIHEAEERRTAEILEMWGSCRHLTTEDMLYIKASIKDKYLTK